MADNQTGTASNTTSWWDDVTSAAGRAYHAVVDKPAANSATPSARDNKANSTPDKTDKPETPAAPQAAAATPPAAPSEDKPGENEGFFSKILKSLKKEGGILGAIAGIIEFFMNISEMFEKVGSFFSGGLSSIGSGIANAAGKVVDTGKKIVHGAGQALNNGKQFVAEQWDRMKAKFVPDMPTDKNYVSACRDEHKNIVYTDDKGCKVVKVRESTGSSMSWANNNPGNMEAGAFARAHGAIGSDGRFAIFPTVEAGFDASKALLKSSGYSNLSLSQVIHKWAPKSDGNDPDGYTTQVSGKTGISSDARMNQLSDHQLDLITHAMAEREGWIPGKVAIVDDKGIKSNAQIASNFDAKGAPSPHGPEPKLEPGVPAKVYASDAKGNTVVATAPNGSKLTPAPTVAQVAPPSQTTKNDPKATLSA